MKFRRIPTIGLLGALIGMMLAKDYFVHGNILLSFIIIISCWVGGEIVGGIIAFLLPHHNINIINSSYWEGVNLMARLFGIMAVIVGLIFLGWGLDFFHNKEYILTWEDKIMYDVVGLFSLSLGVAFLLAEGYYPNE